MGVETATLRYLYPQKLLDIDKGFGLVKRYFIIDQQIAWHFVHYSEYLYRHPSFLFKSNNYPFLIQGSQPITIKG